MSGRDYSRIRVGGADVGIMGLSQALEEIAESHSGRSDEEVAEALLDRLRKRNYIPKSAAAEYSKALVREFRRFLHQPHEEESPGFFSIKVLGPGCSLCNRLEQAVMEVLSELNVPASLEHVQDIKEMAGYGLVRTPALVINDKVVLAGRVPPTRTIKMLIEEAGAGQGRKG